MAQSSKFFLQTLFCELLCIQALFASSTKETVLRTVEQNLVVQGKEAKILSVVQTDGTLGLAVNKDEGFAVRLENGMPVPTSIHWHGLILPNAQDGVAFITQFPIYSGEVYRYSFPLKQAGTFWMHSHVGLQEQSLLAAPLIIHDKDDAKIADQEVVVLLSDFSFTPPSIIFQKLKERAFKKSPMKKKTPDIVEVDYDAFLANHKTLDEPEIIPVEAGKTVRLRCINGASATNFLLSLGALAGEAIAVDGNKIEHLQGTQFDLGVAQRIDVVVKIPQEGGAFPILAQGEGTNKQTGVILATKESALPKLSMQARSAIGRLNNAQEAKLKALFPLAKKPVDQSAVIELGGNMTTYTWTLNGQAWPEVTPIVVENGKRVEITFKNVSSMTHPMHLHGHVFQVTAIDGKAIDGAMRDTVLVLPNQSVTIQFDADNPGVWPLHCHVLYHLEAGMLTALRYKDYTLASGLQKNH